MSRAKTLSHTHKPMALIGLGIKRSDVVCVTIEGSDEETNTAALEHFL